MSTLRRAIEISTRKEAALEMRGLNGGTTAPLAGTWQAKCTPQRRHLETRQEAHAASPPFHIIHARFSPV